MTCSRCGMPCKGDMCKECERAQRQEARGTPAEYRERQEAIEAERDGGEEGAE